MHKFPTLKKKKKTHLSLSQGNLTLYISPTHFTCPLKQINTQSAILWKINIKKKIYILHLSL